MTPHMQALGARTVPREEFLERLASARARSFELIRG
jgi:Leu/Phe-tRNA-protein transferase